MLKKIGTLSSPTVLAERKETTGATVASVRSIGHTIKILIVLGDTNSGENYMKVVKAMNIVGPLTSVIIVVIAVVVRVTAAASAVSDYYPYQVTTASSIYYPN